jgi:N-acetylmuramoyl-L-alanine amidase
MEFRCRNIRLTKGDQEISIGTGPLKTAKPIRGSMKTGGIPKYLYNKHLNIYLHIITFANATHSIKGMKDYTRTKTSLIHILPKACVVLTLFLGLATPFEAQKAYKIDKIVLDAGHGGKDPGCHGNQTREKDIALAIVLDLGRKIKEQYPDIEVIYTRNCDVFIPLNERAAIANRSKADLFISVHCNYIGSRNHATGSETYVLGLHRAEDNLDVAKRENASIFLEDDFEKTYEGFDPYSTEGHIILSMFQNAHLEQSIQLATHVQSAFKRLERIPSRGVKQAGFLVLRETTMPSVLIETGFLSTDADEKFLMKEESQNEVAGAILRAFTNYKNEVEDQQKEIELAGKEIEKIKPEIKEKPAPPVQVSNDVKVNQVAYRIQIAASSKPTLEAKYNSIQDLEVIKEATMYKFLVGSFASYDAAKPTLLSLKSKGFDGAFIVAYKDGQRIKA